MRKFWILFALFFVSICLQAQRQNTFYVTDFPGKTVQQKKANAEAQCNPNTAMPCYIIIDPTLATWQDGTAVTDCAQCVVQDYRSASPSTGATQSAFLGATPLAVGVTCNPGTYNLYPSTFGGKNEWIVCGNGKGFALASDVNSGLVGRDASGNASIPGTFTASSIQLTSGASLQGAPQAGKIAEYWFDEGSGQRVINRAFPTLAEPNLIPCATPSAATCFSNSGFFTSAYVTDSPYGNAYSSDRLVMGTGQYVNVTPSPVLAAGTYVFSVWAKATSGTSKFRLALGPGLTYTADLTATAAWQQFSETITLASGGSLAYALIAADAETDSTDIEVFAPQLNVGVVPRQFQPRAFDMVLGIDGGTTYDPTWTAYGVNTQGGTKYLNAVSSTPVTLRAATVYALVRKTGAETLTGYSPIFTNQYSADPGSFALTANESNQGPKFLFGGTVAPSEGTGGGSPTTVNDGNWHFVVGTYDGSNVDLQLDGLDLGSTALASASTSLSQFWLSWDNGAAYFPGDIAFLSIYEGAHTQAQQLAKMSEVAALVTSSRGITIPAVNRVVVCEGDSITDIATAANGSYCTINGRAQAYASPVVSRDQATSGAGLATLQARAATTSALFAQWRTRNILTVLIGANDLTGTDGATEWANFQGYIATMRSSTPGLKVVCSTVTPQSSSTFNANRNVFNGLMRASTGTCDAIADFAANATIGTDAAGSNATYYPDGEHPSAATQTIMATLMLGAVNSVE